MAQKFNNVIADLSFPNESAEYREARNRLLEQEIEVRRAIEAAAAARRALPPGGPIPEDYVFQGTGGDVRMSELFAPGKDSLVLYSMMYAPERESGCPGCTGLLDGLNGSARHFTQRVNFYVVAKSPLPRILALAEERGWSGLQFLSSFDNTYNVDYYGMSPDGSREAPMVNVFHRDGDVVRHFWSTEMHYAKADPGQHYRNNDLIHPVWGIFDMTRDGRGTDWMPAVTY
jgi:predicted dithiol-disulfide oxidoreductase (DUF899 family)